jgi:hypothetical protein
LAGVERTTLTADERRRWDRVLDLATLAAGIDNDCCAAGLAMSAVTDEEAKGLLSAAVGLAASLADMLGVVTERPPHDLLGDFR